PGRPARPSADRVFSSSSELLPAPTGGIWFSVLFGTERAPYVRCRAVMERDTASGKSSPGSAKAMWHPAPGFRRCLIQGREPAAGSRSEHQKLRTASGSSLCALSDFSRPLPLFAFSTRARLFGRGVWLFSKAAPHGDCVRLPSDFSPIRPKSTQE